VAERETWQKLWSMIMSTKTFHSDLCTALPTTKNIPEYVSPIVPDPRIKRASNDKEKKSETRRTLTFIDGIWRSGWI
jgi:hypothetical protein